MNPRRNRTRRTLSSVLGAVMMTPLMVVALATPAQAGTLAPQCVKAWQYSSGGVYVWNTCARDKRIKVIMAWGPDMSCFTLKAGHDKYYPDPWGRLDRVELC